MCWYYKSGFATLKREGDSGQDKISSSTTWTPIQLEKKLYKIPKWTLYKKDCYSSSYLLNITVKSSSL